MNLNLNSSLQSPSHKRYYPDRREALMIRRINKFIALLIVVSLCLYIVFRNYTPLTVYLSSSSSVTLPAGIILVAVFFFGAVVASLIGLIFGIRTWMRERRYKYQHKQREAFFREFMEARSLSASGDVDAAREKWEKILRRERDSSAGAIARVEYARLLANAGDLKQALRTLDEARSILPENVEILYLAAQLNQDLGNKTSAIDNLALVMYHRPEMKAAEKLRSLSEDAGRIEDALEYNRQVERLGGDAQVCGDTEKRLRFRLLVEENKNAGEPGKLHDQLLSLVREHGDSADVLVKLAELSEAEGRTEEAAQFLARAAREAKSPRYWHEGVKFWLRHDNAQRALAAARAASTESSGEEKIRANIDLIRLYLTLNMADEARRAAEETEPLLRKEKVGGEFHFMLQVLKGICLARLHLYPEADAVWGELGRYDAARHLALLDPGVKR